MGGLSSEGNGVAGLRRAPSAGRLPSSGREWGSRGGPLGLGVVERFLRGPGAYSRVPA